MTRTSKERFAPTVLAVAIAAIGFVGVAPQALAEEDEIAFYTKPDSEIELGLGRVNGDRKNTKFGDYTGMDESRDFAIANISVVRRGENAGYFELSGSDLGLDSRSLSLDVGRQGSFGIRLSYSELPHYWAHGYQSPFVGLESANVTLPAGWSRQQTTTAMPVSNFTTNMRSFDVKRDRKTLGVGLSKFVTSRWEIAANYKQDKKEGSKLIGAVVGNSGGNPRAVILPEPVDWTTDQVDILARYAFEKLQFQFGYHGSFFRNEDKALRWQNPYSGAVWGGAAGDFANAQIGLPPDNQFHQLNASLGYNFSSVTRLTGNLSIGRATQDDKFLPYTVNPGLATRALPRDSLNGEVVTTHASLNFTTKLAPKMGLVATYRYTDRDNNTSRAQYNYVGGDSNAQCAVQNCARLRTNLPVDTKKHQIHTEIDYRLAQDTKLKLGYEFDYIEKSYEAIDWEREHTVKAGVNHRFNDVVSSGASYARSDRDTSKYDASEPFIASYSQAFAFQTIGAPSNGIFPWDNVPSQKKFFLAPRKRDKVRAFVNVSPIEQLDVEFSADFKNDRYTESVLGLRQAKGWAGNVDATLALSENVTGHAFASVENYRSDQRSVQLGGSQQALYTDPNRYWSAEIEDRTVTWGLGFRVRPVEKIELGANFLRSLSRGKTDVSRTSTTASNGAGGTNTLAAIAPLPDVTSRMNRLELFGNYQVQKDLKVRVQYAHERYRSNDWAVDDVAAKATAAPNNGMANVIGTNQVSPDYKVNVVGVSAIYSFR